MIKRYATATSLILLLFTFAFGFQDNWTKFSSTEGRFSVLVPGQPKVSTETKQSSIGPYTNHLFMVNQERSVLIFGWVDYQPNVRLNVPGEIKANKDNFLNGLKARSLSETPITVEGNPGIEFTAETDTVYIKSRVFVIGARPYMLAAVYAKGFEDARGLERFLTSFQTIKKAPGEPHGGR
jgi:hypothetical protein